MKRTQCTLQKGKNTFTIAWIDSKHAKIGRFVQLITLDNEFWQVVSKGGTSDKDMSNQHRTWNNNI